MIMTIIIQIIIVIIIIIIIIILIIIILIIIVIARGDSSVGRLLRVCLVERFAVRISPLAFFADAPYMCGSQKTLRQDYTGCSLAFLTVVFVEVCRHQAIVGELVTDQGIECCALTSLTYLTWLVCWTSVEVAYHRAVRSPLQPL